MGVMAQLQESIDSLISMGLVVTSHVAANAKSVYLHITGDQNGDGEPDEENDNAETWGEAAVLYRPADPTVGPNGETQNMECLFLRWGDDREVIATKDRRWQVELQKGEVCIRSFGPPPAARIWLKPDGSIIVEGASIKLGSSGASEGVPLGDALKSWLDNHKHGYVDDTLGPQLTTGPVLAPYAGGPGTADPSPSPSTKVEVE